MMSYAKYLFAAGLAGWWSSAWTASFECPRAQIETGAARDIVYFPELFAEASLQHYAFAIGLSNQARVALAPDTTAGRFVLPIQGGRLYLVTARKKIESLADFAIVLPEEDDSRGGTFLHGPVPRPLQAVHLEGLPPEAEVCSVQW
jgi:hypothetical protein